MKLTQQAFMQLDESLAWALHKQNCYDRSYPFHMAKSWGSAAPFPDIDGGVFTSQAAFTRVRVYEWSDAVGLLTINDGGVYLDLTAESEQKGLDWLARFQEHLPLHEASATDVPVSFWFDHPQGPRQMERMIAVSPWAGVEANYPAVTRDGLERLMHGFQPSVGGQLILWQGVPGTGKTHALRALASEWRGWADMHYIVDPDNLFGRQAHYLIQVLLDQTESERWKVLVLEDTGELLAADAKQQTGQALSRLLNTVDGLIGQGLRVLVLVTTNEELKTLHPAVSRPGRCAAQVTFKPFTGIEAADWLAAHGTECGPLSTATLAELYAKLGGETQAAPEFVPRVGFGA